MLPAASPPLALDQVLPLGATIPGRSLDIAYRVRLALAAGLSLLVPLVYLALVVGLAWWSYQHASSMPNLDTGRGRASILLRIFYLAPSIAGFAAAGLLVSILFSRPAEEDGPLVLNRAAQPRLFALIERLCAAMGAPMPRRVEITAEPNASAAREGGWRGWVGKPDLTLSIGLTLAAALSTREFVGVLAHEFGHFTQRAGMGFAGFVRGINARVAELAWGRTVWDDRLSAVVGSGIGVLMLVAVVAKAGLGLARLVLRGLAIINHAVACSLLRRMEFDADHYEVQASGSEAFETASRKITVLGELWHRFHLTASFSPARPPNLPDHFLWEAERLAPAEMERYVQERDAEGAKWWSTHPSDPARIAAAHAAAATGIVTSEEPARELFDHFEALAEAVSASHYRAMSVHFAEGQMLTGGMGR